MSPRTTAVARGAISAMLTTEPNELTASIHDRMPVI
jgi:putative SOS response-associated peptidase YedK